MILPKVANPTTAVPASSRNGTTIHTMDIIVRIKYFLSSSFSYLRIPLTSFIPANVSSPSQMNFRSDHAVGTAFRIASKLNLNLDSTQSASVGHILVLRSTSKLILFPSSGFSGHQLSLTFLTHFLDPTGGFCGIDPSPTCCVGSVAAPLVSARNAKGFMGI